MLKIHYIAKMTPIGSLDKPDSYGWRASLHSALKEFSAEAETPFAAAQSLLGKLRKEHDSTITITLEVRFQ